MRQLRTTYGGVESFGLTDPMDTTVRIKDGLLRFDMHDNTSFREAAKLRMRWSGNPVDPILTVHYVTPPFEGIALQHQQHRIGQVCTRFTLLATADKTVSLAGSADLTNGQLSIEYTNLNQTLGFHNYEVVENMDVVINDKLTRLYSQILGGPSSSELLE